jgi:hypothetical protein
MVPELTVTFRPVLPKDSMLRAINIVKKMRFQSVGADLFCKQIQLQKPDQDG